jgi:hypothetical protein
MPDLFWLHHSPLLAFVLMSIAAISWPGEADNKSVAALPQLGVIGLVSEGRAACVAGAGVTSSEAHQTEEAMAYLR